MLHIYNIYIYTHLYNQLYPIWVCAKVLATDPKWFSLEETNDAPLNYLYVKL